MKHCTVLLRDLDTKKIGVEVFGELQNVLLEDNGEDKIIRESNEKNFERLISCVEKIDHILRSNCFLHDTTEGYMTEIKGVGRERTQLLDNLRNRR